MNILEALHRVCSREFSTQNSTGKYCNRLSFTSNMSKNFSVGESVWALWPGSKKYYEATVIGVRKSGVEVDFKDGSYTVEVPLRQVHVSLKTIV